MEIGKKVVCVNGVFGPIIRSIYTELPVKGVTYTIRHVFLGRETMRSDGVSATVGVLLNELKNPPDPHQNEHRELGFCADRFREIEEAVESETQTEKNAVGAFQDF